MNAFYNVATDSETTVTPGDNLLSPEDRSINIRQGGTVTFQGGEAASLETHSSLNMADLSAGDPLKARTRTGSLRMGELQASDIIQVAGTEMTLQNAQSLGLVERDAHGRWIAVPDGAARVLANETPQDAPQDEAQALSNPAIEQELGSLCAAIMPSTQVAIAQQLITDGTVNQNTLARAAGEAAIEPGALDGRLSTVIEGFTAQADSTVKGLGADDPQAFYEWARENAPDALRKAMNDHVMERTTRGYAPLFSRYVESLGDHSPEDILSAEFGSGITARMEGKQVILNIPGRGTMSYRAAVKAGIINVKGI
ncbi:hypothetical protein [Microvirga calopogonii]|uniref:hypothetical protein n=1 Tax=Microvirga calopogonii TaxID=2078013 RepID=UPI000E0DA1C4|nr:hypothetical protein [Microvirga calopogonii]